MIVSYVILPFLTTESGKISNGVQIYKNIVDYKLYDELHDKSIWCSNQRKENTNVILSISIKYFCCRFLHLTITIKFEWEHFKVWNTINEWNCEIHDRKSWFIINMPFCFL